MKHAYLKSTFFVFALFFCVQSKAQIYSQDFNFSGALTSNGWTAHSGGGTNALSTTTGLTYNGHSGSGVGNAVLISNLSGEDDNNTFSSQSTNGQTVYASFLVNITDANTSRTGDYFFHLGSPGGAAWTAFSARVFARIVSGNVNFGLSNTSTATYGTTNFSRNTTYLVVLKYTIVTGTTADPVSMWVLTGMPTTEALAGTAEVANTTTNGTDAISAVGLRQGSATTSVQTVVDAIRVGTSWASVVPLSASAPSTQASSISFSAPTSSQVTASWTSGNGDGRLVKINTSSTFTNPTTGQSYTANATYGGSGEQVVSVGNTNSATVSNLSPGQTYYFRAYEYTSTGLLYNTSTATNNPNSVVLDYPVPVSSSLNPTSAIAGGSSFTLTVTGSGFYPASVINWNGSARTTTYVNSTTLTAAIGSADIASAGTANVTVINPAPGGGTSSAQSFSINNSLNPLISVSSSLTSFTTIAGSPSATQSYTVSGSNLSDDITINAPSGFEIRTGSAPFSSSPITLSYITYPSVFTVEVAPKDATHPYFGTGSPNGYVLNGVQGPVLTMVRGITYKFYFDGQGTCCSSTLGHPFIITNSTVGGAANTGDVINNGVIQYGDSTFFTPDANTPSTIYYMCDVHQSMGSLINVIDPPTGSISPTTIDIRFAPLASGTYTGNIDHTSSGASAVAVAVTGFALASEPTVPSAIAFGTITGNSIVVNTSGGNGSSRIILIRQGSPVGYSPVDGAAVTGVNASFTSALDQGSGDKIVYDGTGNTVTVTNLSALTTYHFTVYEYNGSGATANYQVVGAGTANTSTLASEPTTAATLSLSRMKTDTCVIGVASGNGANRLFVISTSATTFVPTDGTTYGVATGNLSSAVSLGGSDLLIYNGAAATPVVLSGLSAGTTYYVKAFEYNGSGSLTNYRTSTSGSLTFTTPSNILYNGGTYTQDFNGLPSTGSTGMTGFGLGPYYLSTPAVNATSLTGWQHTLIGGTSTDVVFGIDNGSLTSGGAKSYGATGSANRALGSLATGSAVPSFGAVMVNNTGGPLTTITVSYTGQQWRNGGSGFPNSLLFSYAIGSQNISSGVFSTEYSLGFQNPISGGSPINLDGTQAANQVAVNGTITLNANWLPGETLVIRWTDNNDSGNDDGIAIDDFSFSAAGPTTPLAQDSSLFFMNVLTTSMDVNWLSGDGSARMVVMNTTNSFTNPIDGQSYTANSVYSGSGEQVVFNGNGNVVHVDGLTAGTAYYFRVFGYNGFGASSKYNTSTALDNPVSQTTAAPSAATKLMVVSVNAGADPVAGQPFSVVVQAQDSAGSPQTVSVATTVSLSVSYGSGTLSGTTSGVIAPGSNSVTITGVIYSTEDLGVQLQADATSGETLAFAVSNPFNVLGVATGLSFLTTPTSGIVNTPTSAISVEAKRNDFTTDVNYNGTITLTKYSGPGNVVGTLTATCVAGTATFSNVSFSAPGTYVLEASATGLSSAYSSDIVITLLPTFTELVVPKYIAAKTAAAAHNARVPFAACLKIDNLLPNTSYDLKAGVGTDTTASTSYGSGNVWTAAGWLASSIVGAFTTDASGSSGPFWVYIQPTANSTNSRFAAGFNHNLRIGYVSTGGTMPTEPNFIGTKLMTALDIGTTAQTPATTDDGAFLTGTSTSCVGGKYILLYDNTAGTGDPISVYQSRTMIAPNTTSQTELPTLVNDIYLQSSASSVGNYAALIPIGANNSNGIRRIEVRNADNTLFNAATDADGIWSVTANTTTITRRSVVSLTPADALLSTLSIGSTSSTGESCTGSLDGTASVTISAGQTPISYSWNTTPVQTTSTATGLAAGTYVVTVTDASGCSQTTSVTVAAPSSTTITASGPTTFCQGGSVTLTVGTAN
ncbi:MAG: beta strand repeat-containing protein, partial [Bacteroidota bacterium]